MERRAHADRCMRLPPDLPSDMHLMIEAKDKEQAVLELHRIYGIREVVHDSLRPPAKVSCTTWFAEGWFLARPLLTLSAL